MVTSQHDRPWGSTPHAITLAAVVMVVLGCGSTRPGVPGSAAINPVGCTPSPGLNIAYADLKIDHPFPDTHAHLVGLAFDRATQAWLAAYALGAYPGPGQLVWLHTPDLRVERVADIHGVVPKFTRFSDNTHLVTAFQSGFLTVLSTTDGTVLSKPKPTLGIDAQLIDLAMSPDGQWLLLTKGSINLTNAFDDEGGLGLIFLLSGGREDAVAAAFDSTGTLVAIGTRDEDFVTSKVSGNVEVRKREGKDIADMPPMFSIGAIGVGRPIFAMDQPPVKLAFDPTNRWLAVATSGSIELRDFDVVGVTRRASAGFRSDPDSVMAFDPSGRLLVAGNSESLNVYSVPELKALIVKLGAEVTTIAFSPDGCQIAWGDMDGMIHVITSPLP